MAIYTLEYMPCNFIFGLSLFPLFHNSIPLLLSWILYDGLVIIYTVLLTLNKLSLAVYWDSKNSARFCKHHLNKSHL